MSDLVLIPLPTGQWIGLTPQAWADALAVGEAAIPKAKSIATSASVELIDASTAALRFGIKKSWLLERARLNAIPHVRLGKYVRFDPTAIAAHLARGTDQRSQEPYSAANRLNGKTL
jgi:hypothetical protein